MDESYNLTNQVSTPREKQERMERRMEGQEEVILSIVKAKINIEKKKALFTAPRPTHTLIP